MRESPSEVSGVPLVPLELDEHLLRPLERRAQRVPDDVALLVRAGDRFSGITAGELWAEVLRLARGLVQSGVEPGDRVALLSATRLEWLVLDYAILAAGAVTVPIYESASDEQIRWIIDDSGCALLIVETEDHARRCRRRPDVGCREILVIDDGALRTLAQRAEQVPARAIRRRIDSLSTQSMATVIYTSGTTARPKGCMLTHGNLRTNVAQLSTALGEMVERGDRTLLFLPLAHVLAKVSALFCVERGIVVAFASDLESVPEELELVRPTLLVAVPRIFEKIYNAAHHRAALDGKARIFDLAAAVAVRYSKQRAAGRLGLGVRLAHRLFDRLVFAKFAERFGGSLRFAFCGGAPLGEQLTYFFDGVGVRIFEGYGLTETSPILTVNSATAWKPGTVGRPVAGTAIRLTDDDEIQVRGPQVFAGYWRNRTATADAFGTDGWLSTGDAGHLDDDGFLTITGRLKDLIITSGGKNVAPAALEDRLRAHELVSQAVVVGDGRPFVAALLTIDPDGLADWRAEHPEQDGDPGHPESDPAVRAELQRAVDEANRAVSRAESIRAFSVLPDDFAIESGELTPTLKVRRATVLERYRDEIECLYGP